MNNKKLLSLLISCAIIFSVALLPIANITTVAESVKTYTVTASVSGTGGTVSPDSVLTVTSGKSVTCTVTPDDGYVIKDVLINGESFGAVNRYDFVDIKNDCTLVATFAEKIGGDVTEDGYCTEEDVSALRQALLNGESSARVDANYDDVSDIRDLVRINLASYDLYKGNFESGWSIGNSSGSFAFSNDKKSFSFDSDSATDSAYYNNAASFGDYLVSADFYYGDVDYTSKQSYIALVARRVSSVKDYELRVIVDKNTSPVITAELVKRNTSYTTLATFDSDYIQNVIGASEASLEKTYNLKMLCVGSTVYCFINNCLLGSYTDLNEPFLSGGFGMKSYRAKGSVGNFSVLDKSGEKYRTVKLSGSDKNGKLTLHSGEEINSDFIYANIVDYDNTVLNSNLTDSSVSGNLESGENKVDITVLGKTSSITVDVNKHSVSGVNARLESNASKTVTASTAKIYKNLLNDADKFSSEELGELSNAAKTGYTNLQKQLFELNVPFGEKIVSYDFSETAGTFDKSFEMRRGKLYSANGKLYLSQIPYGISTSCYYFDDNYAEISSVSADMMLKSYDASAGLIINANVNGYFYALVALNKNADQVNLRNSAILRIYQKTSNGTTALVAQRDIDICRNELFNMQLTMSSDNVLKVYIDYELSATSDVSSNPEIYNEGYAGVISLSGDALFDNFAVFGNSKSEPKSSSVATAGEYFDDFEDETAGEDPDMWLEPSDNNGVNMQDNWAVSEEDGNLVYSVTPENTVAAKAVFDDVSVDKQKTVLFSEDFDDCQLQSTNQGRRILLENRGWRTSAATFSNTFAGYTSSGKFTEPAGITPVYFTNTTAAYGDHTLECDVNIDAYFEATGSKHAIYIESGATDTSGTGAVGVRLSVNGNNELTIVRLVKKTTNLSSNASTMHNFAAPVDITGKTLHITVTYSGTTVTATVSYGTGSVTVSGTIDAAVNGYPTFYVNAKEFTSGSVSYDNVEISNGGNLFADDFNSSAKMNTNGWNSNSVGTKENGVYSLPLGKAVSLSTDGASLWKNYTLFAKAKITDGEILDTASARICAGYTASGYYYEFGIFKDSSGASGIQLYKRSVTGGKINGQTYLSNTDISFNKFYGLSITLIENKIICKFDGNTVFEVTDNDVSGDITGSIALKNNGSPAAAVPPESSKTYLFAFDKNPHIEADITYSSARKSDANFGFIIRNSPQTAYVYIGYDIAEKKWFIHDSRCDIDIPINTLYSTDKVTLTSGVSYHAVIEAIDDKAVITVSGGSLQSNYVCEFNGITNLGNGKIGLFTNNTLLSVDNVSVELANGGKFVDGVVEYNLFGDEYAGTFEIEDLGNGNLLGYGYNFVGKSNNNGLTFSDTSVTDSSTYCDGAYPSIIKLHNGKYIRVNSKFEVYSSDNGTSTWTKICNAVTEYKDNYNRVFKIFHTNSLTEVKLSDQAYRLFLPVSVRLYKSTNTTTSSGHYTEVWYSDDGGVTWNVSSTDTRDILYNCNNSTSWAESKIIKCSDGTLRMYYSRNTLGCVQYTESYDNGVTWHGLYQVPEMQCAMSSFSIFKDESSSAGDTDYYMVFVNNNPILLGSVFSRTRLSLAKSTDGKIWKFVCDIENMEEEVYSDDLTVTTPLFQIVDPSITVSNDYIYVTYGCSIGSVYDGASGYHNAQHIKFVRLTKDKLTASDWDASNISNMLFTKKIELISSPKTSFSKGGTFEYSGGTIKVTLLDGTTKQFDTARLYCAKVPDMSTAGTKSVTLYDRNGFSVTYTVTVS